MTVRTAWNSERALGLIEARRREPGAMLPILHDLQSEFGYIDGEAVALIADALNVSKAETIGVISFYHDFRSAPVKSPVMKICRAKSCQAAGVERLVERLAEKHGLIVDGDDDGALAIETVYCLGHCALSPAALIDGEPVARLDEAKIDAIVAAAKGRAE